MSCQGYDLSCALRCRASRMSPLFVDTATDMMTTLSQAAVVHVHSWPPWPFAPCWFVHVCQFSVLGAHVWRLGLSYGLECDRLDSAQQEEQRLRAEVAQKRQAAQAAMLAEVLPALWGPPLSHIPQHTSHTHALKVARIKGQAAADACELSQAGGLFSACVF